MKTKEKLKLLNSLELIDYSASSFELEYAIVDDCAKSRVILRQIGITEDVLKECTADETIDLSQLAFQYCGADWFNSRKGFIKYTWHEKLWIKIREVVGL